jgi:hypothetical protein
MVKSGIGQSTCSHACRAKGKLSVCVCFNNQYNIHTNLLQSWTRRPRTLAYTCVPHPSPVFDATPKLLPRLNNNNNNSTNPFAEVDEEKSVADILT